MRSQVVLACLLITSGPPNLLMAAGNDDVEMQLAGTRAQLEQMQLKLDKWLLNAARREEEVEHQIAGRDARIAELSVLLSKERARVASLQAALDANELHRTANRDSANAGGREIGSPRDLQTLRAELSRLRQESRAKQTEAEKLRSYVQKLQADIRQRDDAVRAAREVVRVSKLELDDRALKIERLSQELESAHTALSDSDGGPLKTRHLATRGVSVTDPEAAAMGRGLYGEARTASQSVPPDALRQARAGARDAALEYLRLRDQEFPPDDLTRPNRPAVHQAFRKMFSRQARVANLTGARGLYQVRENDTLSVVAGHATGDQANWPALFAANAHLMASPDQLIAGLVLIIPSP